LSVTPVQALGLPCRLTTEVDGLARQLPRTRLVSVLPRLLVRVDGLTELLDGLTVLALGLASLGERLRCRGRVVVAALTSDVAVLPELVEVLLAQHRPRLVVLFLTELDRTLREPVGETAPEDTLEVVETVLRPDLVGVAMTN
jgi:hypothetical protein